MIRGPSVRSASKHSRHGLLPTIWNTSEQLDTRESTLWHGAVLIDRGVPCRCFSRAFRQLCVLYTALQLTLHTRRPIKQLHSAQIQIDAEQLAYLLRRKERLRS